MLLKEDVNIQGIAITMEVTLLSDMVLLQRVFDKNISRDMDEYIQYL